MIKIGIDPSGTGTSAIVVYKNGEFIEKLEFGRIKNIGVLEKNSEIE